MEDVEELNYSSKCSLMCYRCIAVSAVILHHSIHAVKLTMMFFAFDSIKHFLNQIIDEEHFKLYARIVYCDRQIISDVVAESANSTVVIRSYPLTHKIRETVNHNSVACFFTIGKEQFFACLLTQAVLRGTKASCKRGLNR